MTDLAPRSNTSMAALSISNCELSEKGEKKIGVLGSTKIFVVAIIINEIKGNISRQGLISSEYHERNEHTTKFWTLLWNPTSKLWLQNNNKKSIPNRA